MKYRGKEIGRFPTRELIEECIIHMNAIVTVEQVMDFYGKREWKTKKGTAIRALDAAVNALDMLERRKHNMKKQDLKVRTIEQNERKLKRRAAIRIRKENQKPKKKFVLYTKQLEDPRWLAFRDFVFFVRGKKCEICGSEKCVQVHHLLYRKGAMAWEYSTRDVAVLCRECHSKIHGIKEKE